MKKKTIEIEFIEHVTLDGVKFDIPKALHEALERDTDIYVSCAADCFLAWQGSLMSVLMPFMDSGIITSVQGLDLLFDYTDRGSSLRKKNHER